MPDRAPRDDRPSAGPRLLVVGASNGAGLGYDGRPFPQLVAERLGATEVLDLTVSGELLGDTLAEHTDAIRDFRADLAVLDLGAAESLVHPRRSVQERIERWVPPQWHGVTGLEPRARYSGDRRRRRRQRLESAAKVGLKHALIRVTGGGPRVPVEEFAAQARRLVTLLEEAGTHSVVVQLHRIDERLFPGTTAARRQFSAVLQSLGASALVDYLPVEQRLRYWDDFLPDHAHLARGGHETTAAIVTPPLARWWAAHPIRDEPGAAAVRAEARP